MYRMPIRVNLCGDAASNVVFARCAHKEIRQNQMTRTFITTVELCSSSVRGLAVSNIESAAPRIRV